jgi:hypothetical protein
MQPEAEFITRAMGLIEDIVTRGGAILRASCLVTWSMVVTSLRVRWHDVVDAYPASIPVGDKNRVEKKNSEGRGCKIGFASS